MAQIKLTTARQVDTLRAGSYTAAPNLILRVKPTGARAWVFRYQVSGKVKELGVGKAGTKERGLAEARELAMKMREAVRNGSDPAHVLKPRHDPAAMTFRQYAASVVEAKRRELSNRKAAEQWASTLEAYAYPMIGDKRPVDVSYRDIERVLTAAALATKRETMSRVRQRLQAVLDYAAKCEGEPHRFNPVLAYRLPRRKPGEVKHHAAAPYQQVPEIMAALRARDSTSAYLLRFSILTVARSGEARGARWPEVVAADRTWQLPADRMKARRPHRVWLCDEAVDILEVMEGRRHRATDRIFPGAGGGLLSDVAVNKTLHSILAAVTAHGFRASFRQWAAEQTSFSREAVELCLAHVAVNRVDAAYQRSDLYEARKPIMAAWSSYCRGEDNVVDLTPMLEAANRG